MTPEITIVLACRDGAAFLPAQLDSIAAQQGVNWRLVAGDDGSTDATRDILDKFLAAWPDRVSVVRGPGKGAAAHFLALLDHAVAQGAGAVAFADQDDVWLPGKLSEAADGLQNCGSAHALFLSAIAVWDGHSPPVPLPSPVVRPEFTHALVQNIGPGHAMVVSAALAAFMVRLARNGAQPVWHDWWAYQLVTAMGGDVRLGRQVQVLYRQHADNLVGQAGGMRGVLRKACRMVAGKVHADMAAQTAALAAGRAAMTGTARQVLDSYVGLPGWGMGRAMGVWAIGLHRSGAFGRIAIALAAGMGVL